jgi:phage shock protein PspC (stress-responsive transcriptional regulator)
MKEITRIHIAKTSYDIEMKAKKDLEAYLKMLEAYSHDTEIIEDIEIRITEILDERGVKKGGVIAEADIAALKQQLGEPREFMTDGDIVVGQEGESAHDSDTVRKLYRNTDNAVIGGVLSGIASFFKIDTVWIRLAFIILLFASFGTALLVYVVLWVAVPPARTAADKLQMAGRAVTVGSIRQLNENEASRPLSRGGEATKRALAITAGIICIIGATGAAMMTAAATIALVTGGQQHVLSAADESGFFIAAFVLASISGLLLTALFILGAYASFAQKMTRRVLVSICIVIILGLVSFGTAVGLVSFGGFHNNQQIKANTRESTMALPAGVETATSLMINDAQGVNVTYVVTKDKPSATLRTVLRDGATIPTPKVTLVNDSIHIDVSKIVDKDCESLWWCQRTQQELIIRGPALGKIAGYQLADVSYEAGEQDILTVTAEQSANAYIAAGTIKTLKVTGRESASVSAAAATVMNLEADLRMSAQVEVGTVQTLIVSDLDSCPSDTREARVGLVDVRADTMILNGVSQPVKSIDTGCTEIEIEQKVNE